MSDEPNYTSIPLYEDYFHHHEKYERFHVHLVGLVSSSNQGDAIKVRRNIFGRPKVIDAVADPYVTVETVGDDTGSTEYFPVGKHKFGTLKDCQTPIWDAKCVLIAKKGGVEGVQFRFLDENTKAEDKLLFGFTLSRDEMPETSTLKDSKWTRFTKTIDHPDYSEATFEYHVMVTDGADRIVTPEETALIVTQRDGYTYSEDILPDDTECDDDNALLQSWTNPDNTRAVLWVLGRNDCFMHPHVTKRLFAGYDIYVLNYKMNGHCRRKGWVHDPHFNSHNRKGTFDVYIRDITSALEIMGRQSYDTILGYAHSTGGPVLLNYLMEAGDAAFDAFLFNSPFLDWGFVGGDMIEFVLEHMGMMQRLGTMKIDAKVGVAVTPEELKDTPIHYMNQDIVFCDWSARLWSLYHFDFGTRPLFKVPMTVGFAKGVTDVHTKLESWHKRSRAVTAKPFLCITSRGDDVLKAPETLSRADWIGPGRWEIELNDNGHDVFLSYDEADTDMAIDMCLTWMRNRRLA